MTMMQLNCNRPNRSRS